MILVTGGAGYIGSHVTRNLLDKGYSVLVLDNLITGHIDAVDKRCLFVRGEVGDLFLLNNIFKKFNINAVMHFAANCLVEESVNDPLKYYQNNVGKSLNLIEEMIKHNIKNLIFSSTCAIYGIPDNLPISEQTPTNPINPYGKSKLIIENIFKDVTSREGVNYIALRYFNVAGAYFSGEIGEDHNPETHLIPTILQHLQGKTDYIEVYGNDYDTVDGTCVRDYIHVSDISNAHILALEHLLRNTSNQIIEYYNLGSENGYSVLEIINACEKITGRKATIKFHKKREGDPLKLVASSQKIKEGLGWLPIHDLNTIIKSAWNWHCNKPEGYN